MKITKITILVLLLAILIVGALLFLRGDEDTWLCQNGLWVKHGLPKKEMPFELCGKSPDYELAITAPLDKMVSSPLEVSGIAKSNWFFEASFPIQMIDLQGNLIAQSYVQTRADWLVEGQIEFSGEISFVVTTTTKAMLIFKRDNPSGMKENDKAVSLPVILLPVEKMRVKVFFNNNINLDPEASCNKVFDLEREIAKTEAVARAALLELLKGPTTNEEAEGYFTSLNKQGIEIQSLIIQNGVANVDFNEQLQFQVGGSCRVSAIRAQITETLKQFSTVNDVIISINGRTDDILQP